MKKEEDDTWAQTVITITPQDDGNLREIDSHTLVSGPSSTQLQLGPFNVIHEQALVRPLLRHLIDPTELEETEQYGNKDVSCQTELQGYPKVELHSIPIRNEATQTLYISKITPVLRPVSNIIVSFNDKPMPVYKVHKPMQTVITIHEVLDTVTAVKRLEDLYPEQDASVFVIDQIDSLYMEISNILNFIIERLFWICDPKAEPVPVLDAEVQTDLRFNSSNNKYVFDQAVQTSQSIEHAAAQAVQAAGEKGAQAVQWAANIGAQTIRKAADNAAQTIWNTAGTEAQTGLTVRPIDSNSHLLTSYVEVGCMIQNMLKESLDNKLTIWMDMKALVEEILVRCEGYLRFPPKEQVVQTLIRMRENDKSDAVLRKLNARVVTDPQESQAIVKSILDQILKRTCRIVECDARRISKSILSEMVKKAGSIGVKLDAVSNQQHEKPIEKILQLRRQKLIDALKGKVMVNVATQTDFGGVNEVKKWSQRVCEIRPGSKKYKICMEHECEHEPKPQGLRDILLRKNPNYVIAKVAEVHKDPNLLLACPPSKDKSVKVKKEVCPCPKPEKPPKKEVEQTDSGRSWSVEPEAVVSKAWSDDCSTTEGENRTKVGSRDRMSKKSLCACPTKSQCGMPPQTAKALQILKSTFCTRSTCPVKAAPIDINLIRQREAEESKSTTKKCHGCKACHKT